MEWSHISLHYCVNVKLFDDVRLNPTAAGESDSLDITLVFVDMPFLTVGSVLLLRPSCKNVTFKQLETNMNTNWRIYHEVAQSVFSTTRTLAQDEDWNNISTNHKDYKSLWWGWAGASHALYRWKKPKQNLGSRRFGSPHSVGGAHRP